MIYTLFQVGRDTCWDAAMGIRTMQRGRKHNSISVRQSFDTRNEAVQWLLGLAIELTAPSLPKTVRAIPVPLRLGGQRPERTP